MKINFDTALKALSGEVMQDDNKVALTLKAVAMQALLAFDPEDRISGVAKFERYQLAQKIHVGGEVELKPEEAAMLKERIGINWSVSVVGPAYILLNG